MSEQSEDGRRRVVIELVSPEIDCSQFAIKRVVGETVVVEADVFVPDSILAGQRGNAFLIDEAARE